MTYYTFSGLKRILFFENYIANIENYYFLPNIPTNRLIELKLEYTSITK